MSSRCHAVAVVVAAMIVSGCADGTTQTEQIPTVSTPRSTRAVSSSSTAVKPSMPKVAGMRLSDARARLSAQGYPKVEEIDATGQGRQVLAPDNWIVEAQTPEPDAQVPPGTQITLRVRKPTDGAGQASPAPGVVPNVVCKDLQAAQNALQAAGFYNLGSEDASGQGRQQLVDRNWVVVRQSAAANSKPDKTTRILLSAVKFGEPTGTSGCQS